MAFKLGDLIIDRIIVGVAETTQGELLYTLTNLQDATIDITSDSVDAVDGTGAVIKTFYRAKTGEFTATNSTVNLPIIGAMSGSDAEYASPQNALTIPMIITTANATGTVLPGMTAEGKAGKIVVNAVAKNGTLGDAYELAASGTTEKTFIINDPASGSSDYTITFNPQTGDERWIVKYDRQVNNNGVKIANRSDKFPKTVKLTLKVLIVDPCEPDVVRAAYVVLPSFQPSADISVSFTTDGTLDFSGTLQTSYCGADKVLYEIYVCADDEEDAA